MRLCSEVCSWEFLPSSEQFVPVDDVLVWHMGEYLESQFLQIVTATSELLKPLDARLTFLTNHLCVIHSAAVPSSGVDRPAADWGERFSCSFQPLAHKGRVNLSYIL